VCILRANGGDEFLNVNIFQKDFVDEFVNLFAVREDRRVHSIQKLFHFGDLKIIVIDIYCHHFFLEKID